MAASVTALSARASRTDADSSLSFRISLKDGQFLHRPRHDMTALDATAVLFVTFPFERIAYRAHRLFDDWDNNSSLFTYSLT